MFYGPHAAVSYSVLWDLESRVWRVADETTGLYLVDDQNQPRAWESFSIAWDDARKAERTAA
jgi:hypothetical protein